MANLQLDEAIGILAGTKTAWDGDFGVCGAVRDELYPLLDLAVPERRFGARLADGTLLGHAEALAGAADDEDEHASYLALVKEMGY